MIHVHVIRVKSLKTATDAKQKHKGIGWEVFLTFFEKMIIGHGIDLQEIAAIEKAMDKPRFAEKVLTDAEYQVFSLLKGRRQVEYLAGRWAAKEAFSKAVGTGIGTLGFQDLEILADEKGAPFFKRSPLECKIWVSISHSGSFVQASVILEKIDES